MAVSFTVAAITREAGTGIVRIAFDDGYGMEFPSVAAAKAWAEEVNENPAIAKRLALAYLVARSPTLAQVTSLVGKTVTMDLSKANIFTVV
jgi:hypothetical protein